MSGHPLLSVCIPTYNRALFLEQCLESIAPQIVRNNLESKINIIIADNASTDETEKIVARFITKYPELITYFKNETNIGFDRSFTRLIEKSQSTYCLCLGDDDALFEDSLSYLVNLIEKNQDVGMIWMNNWGYDKDLQNPILLHPNLTITSDKRYAELAEFIHAYQPYENLVGFFVGLSNQLFRRADWVSWSDKEKYFSTQAIHMYICLNVFKTSPFMVITKPIVKTRASNIRWNVFPGLETISGRVRSTVKIAVWIRDAYNLPISNTRLRLRILSKEYWSSFKEGVKALLVKSGFKNTITWYRNIRNAQT